MSLPTDPIVDPKYPSIWECPLCSYPYDWADASWNPGEPPWCHFHGSKTLYHIQLTEVVLTLAKAA